MTAGGSPTPTDNQRRRRTTPRVPRRGWWDWCEVVSREVGLADVIPYQGIIC